GEAPLRDAHRGPVTGRGPGRPGGRRCYPPGRDGRERPRPGAAGLPGGQLTAFFTSSAILASVSGVSSVSANAVGHIVPSSRFALSLKPNVAYLVLNFDAPWKKQTTLPSLAYAGIPYQVLGVSSGAFAV